jgi:exodeoxyribonuclease-3
MDKGFRDFVQTERPDVICLQETKAHREQVNLDWMTELGYQGRWNSAVKKGYSGTVIFSRIPPKSTSVGMGIGEHDSEGRIVSAEFEDFELITVYTPNSQRALARLDYRMQWDEAFTSFVEKRRNKKPIIFCGDLNVAHQEIDLANPANNHRNAGFTQEERASFTRFIDLGFIDSFRQFDQGPDNYSWWTYRMNCRSRNVGWRLDYFLVDKSFWDNVQDAKIRREIMGSDHCPVELRLKS